MSWSLLVQMMGILPTFYVKQHTSILPFHQLGITYYVSLIRLVYRITVREDKKKSDWQRGVKLPGAYFL